jgi:hypothetical protein
VHSRLAVQKLNACHEDNPAAKFLGVCNAPKADMDHCFRAEKERMRKENARIAREKRERFESALKAEQQQA